MKNRKTLATLLGWFALALAPASELGAAESATTAGTGSVEGRVVNTSNGVFLQNARVTVAGTTIETFTGEGGTFRLTGVPAGTTTVRVEYTGLTPQKKSILVSPGAVSRADFQISLLRDRSGSAGEVVQLDTFTVEGLQVSAEMMALNEQRTAPNIKNVVASDEYADGGEGNIGNFMRNIPGIDIGYSGGFPRTISIRGFPPSGTLLMIDGGEIASSTANGDGRHVEFDAVKMNNIDRVEVTKVPTPDLPANAQGGSVNVISKSGRDLRKPLFSYRVFGTLNSRGYTNTGLNSRRAVPTMGDIRPLRPAFDFNYLAPITPSFAFNVGGGTSDPYTKGVYVLSTWDLVRNVQQSHQARTLDRMIKKSNAVVGLEWKINPDNLVKASAQYIAGRFLAGDNLQTLNFGAGATGDGTFVQGAPTGVGSSSRTHYNLKWNENTTHLTTSYRHDGRIWKIEANGSYSRGVSKWRDIDKGFFQSVTTTLSNFVLRGDGLGTRDPVFPMPAHVSAVDRGGAAIDVLDGSLYTVGTATSNQWLYTNIKKLAQLSVTRDFGTSWPFSVKTGVAVNKQDRDIRRPTRSWAFRPASTGASAADRIAGRYDVMDTRVSQDAQGFYPGQTIQWVGTAQFYELYRQRPEWFVENEQANHTATVNGSKEFAETVSAGYLRTDFKLLRNQLWVVAGVRYERTDVEGAGPLNDVRAGYRQDANGNLLLDSAGRPILVTSDALTLTRLRLKERGAVSKRDYDGFFPSLNSTYTITDKLLFRAAYARTIGRPNLTQIIPGVTVADPSAAEVNRTINVVNVGLLPWESDAYDLSLEAYLLKDVTGSVGVFRKDIRNFFGSIRTAATPELLAQYGLSGDYIDYDIVTTNNIGTAHVEGFEFNVKYTLGFLPRWASGMQVFVNGVVLDVKGPSTANFGAFSPRNINWGVSWAQPRFLLRVTWNRAALRPGGLVATSATIPAGTQDFRAPQTIVNASGEFRLTKRLSLFATAGNLTDAPFTTLRYAPHTPGYARIRNPISNSVDMTCGIKGSF